MKLHLEITHESAPSCYITLHYLEYNNSKTHLPLNFVFNEKLVSYKNVLYLLITNLSEFKKGFKNQMYLIYFFKTIGIIFFGK
jgi:hypothetical protein